MSRTKHARLLQALKVVGLFGSGVTAAIVGCSSDTPEAPTSIGTDGGADGAFTPTPTPTTASCAPGRISCSGTCVDTTSDLANCGACGTACSGEQVCSHNGCALTCVGATTKCGTTCNDTQVDPNHCGGCDTVCPAGQVCSKGACALTCAANLLACGASCVDPTTSDAFCGATAGCGQDGGARGSVCGAGLRCSVPDGGVAACAPSCALPFLACGSACVDSTSDPLNCGGCGNACSATDGGAACVAGHCAPTGLVRYFPFTGDTTDHGPLAQNLTATGATLTTDRHGTANQAYTFDGTTSYMVGPGTGLPVGNEPRTFTAWVRPTADRVTQGVSSGAFIVTGSGDCTDKMFGVARSVPIGAPSETLSLWAGCDDLDSATALPSGTWAFVAIRYDGVGVVSQFVNATRVDQNLVGAALVTAASQLWLGAETTNNTVAGIRDHFTGDIDEVRIYRRALTNSEISDINALP